MPDQCGAITMPTARSIPSSRIRVTPSAMNGGECFMPRYARNAPSPAAAFSSRSIAAGLRARDVEQREHVADRRVALPQLLQVLGRRRAPAADVRVVALDVVGAVGGPVRHHQHADRFARAHVVAVRSCTRSTSRSSVSGARARQHAVAQVEHVPAASAGPAQDVERLRLDDLPRAQARGRVEVPLDRAVEPDALPRHVERHPPVDPDHVAPAARISGSSSPVPTPKWIRGTPRSDRPSNTSRIVGSTCRS